jgi:hypothetical protein
MTNEQKRKRGRPALSAADTRPHRIVFMADDATRNWLAWHSSVTDASVPEIIRRALAAYRLAHPD